jgi:hypothetical protein
LEDPYTGQWGHHGNRRHCGFWAGHKTKTKSNRRLKQNNQAERELKKSLYASKNMLPLLWAVGVLRLQRHCFEKWLVFC